MPFDFLKPKTNKTIHKYPTDFLLGDLLVKAGVITQAQLDEAVKLAGNKHLHVGQMLIMAGYISPRDLQAAVDAQSMLRDSGVEGNMATKCLKIACKTGMSFADVVRDQDQSSNSNSTNRLGEVLLEAGLIDTEQFGRAMQRSMSTGLPLGRILVLNGALQDSVLTMALELQVRIRDGMSTRYEAVTALSGAAGVEPVSQDQTMHLESMVLTTPRKKGLRLGELLVLAGLMAEIDVMNCLEISMVQSCQIGQIMLAQGFVSDETLNSALELQKRIDEDNMDPMEAAEILGRIRTTGQNVHEAIEEHTQSKPEEPKAAMNFEKLLLLSRVVTDEDIESALQQAAKSPQVLSRVLNLTGYIDEPTMQAVLQAYTMMTNGFLSQDDTVIALDYCLHKPADTRVTFGQALSELGWNAMVPLQMQSAHSVDISQVRLAAMQPPDAQKTSTQDFAESTLGALAELETAAKAVNDSAGAETNGQTTGDFWGIDGEGGEAQVDEDGNAIEPAEDEVGEVAAVSPSSLMEELMAASADQEPAVATGYSEGDEIIEEDEPVVEEIVAQAVADELIATVEDAIEHADNVQALDEVAEAIESGIEKREAVVQALESAKVEDNIVAEAIQNELVQENVMAQAALAAVASEMEEEAAAAALSIESASALAAELENMSAEEQPAAAEPVASDATASLMADLEATIGASPAEPAVASTAASLLADLEISSGKLPKVEPKEVAPQIKFEAPTAAAADLLKELEASSGGPSVPTETPAAASLLAELEAVKEAPVAEPTNGAATHRDNLTDLFSTALNELKAEEKQQAEPTAAKDTQRAVPRRNDTKRPMPTDFDGEDEMSLRDLFSERLTEPHAEPMMDGLASPFDAPTPPPPPAGAAPVPATPAAETAAGDSARSAQELMEELLSRAAADETSKKDEAVRAEQEAKTKLEAEEKSKREEQARKDAEVQARKEADEKARKEAEERARKDAEELARRVEAAKREAEVLRDTETRKKVEAEALAKRQAEDLARLDAEEKARAASKAAAAAAVAPAAAPVAAVPEPATTAAAQAAADAEAAKKPDSAFWATAIPEGEAAAAAGTSASIAATAPDAEAIKIQSSTAEMSQATAPAPQSAAPAPQAAAPAPQAAASAPQAAAAAVPVAADGKVVKNADLLAAATKAAKAVEQAEPGSPAKEELKGALITSLSRLAESYYEQGDYAEAQGLYERILMLRQSQLGPKHASLGADLTNLAGVLCVQGKFAQAEPFVKRVVGIIESTEPLDHMKLADSLSTLAGILFQQGKYADCEPLLERALKLRQEKLGAEHPEVADNLRDYAKLLKKLGRDTDAERVYMQAKAILAKRPKQPVA